MHTSSATETTTTMMTVTTSHLAKLVLTLPLIALFLGGCQAPVYAPSKPISSPYPSTPPSAPSQPSSETHSKPLDKPKNLPSEPLQNPAKQPETSSVKTAKPEPATAEQIRRRNQSAASAARAQPAQSANDGSHIPAFNNLVKQGVKSLRAGNLMDAEQQFTQAQRLGPQSPAPYMYLSEIAIKRGQATKAENFARKGLLVSRSARYDKALWKMVEISGKMRNRTDIVAEAQAALSKL